MSNSCTGAQALVFGILDSGVTLATGVPGFPISGIMELLKDSGMEARWSINEKVALEAALGASAVGRRAVVIVKHVGMNVLADPLVTSVTHTIGAGLVIIAGDDPGTQQSQNEQDSRYYGLLAEVPVFDPRDPAVVYSSMCQAFNLSEEVHTPVIIRITDRLNNETGFVERTKLADVEFPTFDRDVWSYTMKGKHQLFHTSSYPRMQHVSAESELKVRSERGKKLGIISSGYLSTLVEQIISDGKEDISHLALTIVNPLPIKGINCFINRHERTLVVEESESVIEHQLSCRGVLGKLTGHIGYGKVEASDIIQALDKIDWDIITPSISPETIESRGFSRNICDDCPYHVLYRVLGTIDIPVAGDLGCSVRTAPPPMGVVDLAYSLGSSIATATGFDKKGIALIGDYGLVHTGLQGLIEAVHHHKDVLVVVLQNTIAALTGGQEVPDMTDVVRTLVPDTTLLDIENISEPELATLLTAELEKSGVSVLLVRGKCTMY
ncbi:MAG: thiamine pyrophosphate-dependent enzyme [Methanosarcinales archaeon]|nr:thiamine pyrophosphate-dependent enzyme [Methanosarcinales archaeon]